MSSTPAPHRTGRAVAVVSMTVLLALGIGGAWLVDVLVRRDRTTAAAPPESVDHVAQARQASFDRQLETINHTLAEALRAVGVSSAMIEERKNELRRLDGLRWVHERLDVKVSRKAAIMGRKLAMALSDIPDVRYSLKPGEDERLILRIVLAERETHRIVIQPVAPPANPQLAIVIDDVGYRRRSARALMEIEQPLTFSVLPDGPHSRVLAEEAAERGHEIMLHVPLEPEGGSERKGAGEFLRADLPKPVLRSRVTETLVQVPYVAGVNNHMGSLFTTRTEAMRVLLREVSRRGLYFLDSRTTTNSVALDVARELGVPVLERDVFLDEELEPEAIKRALDRAVSIASQRGRAVAIGHPHPSTVDVLTEALPSVKEQGVELVRASVLLQAAPVLTSNATP